MAVPQRLTICDLAIATDGGTVFVRCKDESGRERTIRLVQRMNPHRNEPPYGVPGRLYLDRELVALRSELETGVVALLRESVSCVTDEQTVAFTTRIIDFVTSDEYLRFAERVERVAGQATDPTRYTVRIACDAENRNRVVVGLARVEGIGLHAARERLDRQQPLAEDVPAMEVPKVVAKYVAAGLTVRFEPPFRWPLS